MSAENNIIFDKYYTVSDLINDRPTWSDAEKHAIDRAYEKLIAYRFFAPIMSNNTRNNLFGSQSIDDILSDSNNGYITDRLFAFAKDLVRRGDELEDVVNLSDVKKTITYYINTLLNARDKIMNNESIYVKPAVNSNDPEDDPNSNISLSKRKSSKSCAELKKQKSVSSGDYCDRIRELLFESYKIRSSKEYASASGEAAKAYEYQLNCIQDEINDCEVELDQLTNTHYE